MSPSPLLPSQEGGQQGSARIRSHSFAARSVLGQRDLNTHPDRSAGMSLHANRTAACGPLISTHTAPHSGTFSAAAMQLVHAPDLQPCSIQTKGEQSASVMPLVVSVISVILTHSEYVTRPKDIRTNLLRVIQNYTTDTGFASSVLTACSPMNTRLQLYVTSQGPLQTSRCVKA